MLIYFFAAVGILDTAYLIYHKLRGTDVACLFFPPEWCHTVQYSKYSKTFGVPNSMAGFAMYAAIIMFLAAYQAGMLAFWPVQAVVAFGFAFSLYFTYVQARILRAFCTWCVLSAFNFFVMFVAAFFL
jgi:uncharacterized membrane protein